MDNEMLTIEAAATRLDVSAGTVRRLIRAGRLPLVRFSHRNIRVPVAALEAFMTSSVAEALAKHAAASKARAS